MHFKRRKRSFDAEAGILPLINVVFLLLIFFMLAGRLSEGAPFQVTPPKSAEAGPLDPADRERPREAAILLAADGRLALNGQPMEAAALQATVQEAVAAQPDLPVSLKADAAAEATEVVAVMETLRDAGVRRLQLFAQAAGAPQPGSPAETQP